MTRYIAVGNFKNCLCYFSRDFQEIFSFLVLAKDRSYFRVFGVQKISTFSQWLRRINLVTAF